jgi:hypothetical protein
MKIILRKRILKLYPEFHTIYGPYLRKQDGRRIVILSDGIRKSARQYAKVKLEAELNRRLSHGEEVDHKDNDFTNDKISNLQVLDKYANTLKASTSKHGRAPKVKCRCCGTKFRSRRKIYCSNPCRYEGRKQGLH